MGSLLNSILARLADLKSHVRDTGEQLYHGLVHDLTAHVEGIAASEPAAPAGSGEGVGQELAHAVEHAVSILLAPLLDDMHAAIAKVEAVAAPLLAVPGMADTLHAAVARVEAAVPLLAAPISAVQAQIEKPAGEGQSAQTAGEAGQAEQQAANGG